MPSKPTTRLRKQFGERLAAARIAAGYRSAEDFAKDLRVAAPAYRKNERDGSLPKYETILEIARLTECDLHWLLTGNRLDRQGEKARQAA